MCVQYALHYSEIDKRGPGPNTGRDDMLTYMLAAHSCMQSQLLCADGKNYSKRRINSIVIHERRINQSNLLLANNK